MATFTVSYHPKVLSDDLRALPRNILVSVVKAIEERLTTEPMRYGMRLRKGLTGLWRIRVGNYRVAYAVREQTVWICVVDHRKNVYKEALRRWAKNLK